MSWVQRFEPSCCLSFSQPEPFHSRPPVLFVDIVLDELIAACRSVIRGNGSFLPAWDEFFLGYIFGYNCYERKW